MLGERIRELRRLNGMTQSELAKQLGISASAVGMYEQGRREPDHAMLGRLCTCFGVTSDYLLETGSRREQHDLDHLIDQVRESILSPEGLLFDGVLLHPEDSEKIVDAIRLGVRFVMEQKQKQNPK